MVVEEKRVVAECRSYGDLIQGIRARINELEVAYHTVDEIAGLPQRYLAKILAPNGNRHFGSISLGPYLGALGLEIHLVDNQDDYDALRRRLAQRKKYAGDPARGKRHKRRSHLDGCSAWGRLMNARQRSEMRPEDLVLRARKAAMSRSPEFRVRRAKAAAEARWSKCRAAVGG